MAGGVGVYSNIDHGSMIFEKKSMSIWKTHESIWMKPQLCEVGKILNDIPLQFKDFHFRMFLVGSLPEENNR